MDLKLEDKMENTKTKREAVDENDEEAKQIHDHGTTL